MHQCFLCEKVENRAWPRDFPWGPVALYQRASLLLLVLLLLKSLGLKSILIVTHDLFFWSPSAICSVLFFQRLSPHFHLMSVASSLQASFPLADIYWVAQLITLETGSLFFHLKNPSAVAKPFWIFISLSLALVQLKSRLPFCWCVWTHQKMTLHCSPRRLPHQLLLAGRDDNVTVSWISHLPGL